MLLKISKATSTVQSERDRPTSFLHHRIQTYKHQQLSVLDERNRDNPFENITDSDVGDAVDDLNIVDASDDENDIDIEI